MLSSFKPFESNFFSEVYGFRLETEFRAYACYLVPSIIQEQEIQKRITRLFVSFLKDVSCVCPSLVCFQFLHGYYMMLILFIVFVSL